MPSCIKLRDRCDKVVWEKNFSNTEAMVVRGYCCKSKNAIAIIPATFSPVRTNNLRNFAQDFFLPTTLNHAIRVKSAVGKVFAILASLTLDTATFPLRLFTCVPRVISNSKQPEHQLLKYLKQEKVDKKILAPAHVKVRLSWEAVSRFSSSTYTGGLEQHWEEKNINFVEVPTNPGHSKRASGVSWV